MYLTDATAKHIYLCRVWNGKPGDYIVYRGSSGTYYYYNKDTKQVANEVKVTSSIWGHSDFVECTKDGELKEQQRNRLTLNQIPKGMCFTNDSSQYVFYEDTERGEAKSWHSYRHGQLYRTNHTPNTRDIWYLCNKHGVALSQTEVNNLTKPKEEQMNENNVNYIGGDYKVVKVKYIDGGKYNFKADIDLDLEENTLVVVEAKNGLGLATVVEVYENCVDNAAEIKKATAWVVNVVDTTAQDQRKEATRQREYILQQLDEKKAQMESISVYALLAKTDPQAAKLLEQLETLGK